MASADLRLAPVRRGGDGGSVVIWIPIPSGRRCQIEIDERTIRLPGMEAILIESVEAVAFYDRGFGAALEFSLVADECDGLSRLTIPLEAFVDEHQARRIAKLIHVSIGRRGEEEMEAQQRVATLAHERAARTPWLAPMIAATTLVAVALRYLLIGGEGPAAMITLGAAVPDLVAAGDYGRLLTATFLHDRFLHAAAMFIAWCFMGPLEKRGGTSMVAVGFIGGSVLGYAALMQWGGGWQAFGGSAGIAGVLGATAIVSVLDPSRIEPLAVRGQAAAAVRNGGIFMLAAGAVMFGIESHYLGPFHIAAIFGGVLGGMALVTAGQTSVWIERGLATVAITVVVSASALVAVGAGHGPNTVMRDYFRSVGVSGRVDATALAAAISDVRGLEGSAPDLLRAAESARKKGVRRAVVPAARELLRETRR